MSPQQPEFSRIKIFFSFVEQKKLRRKIFCERFLSVALVDSNRSMRPFVRIRLIIENVRIFKSIVEKLILRIFRKLLTKIKIIWKNFLQWTKFVRAQPASLFRLCVRKTNFFWKVTNRKNVKLHVLAALLDRSVTPDPRRRLLLTIQLPLTSEIELGRRMTVGMQVLLAVSRRIILCRRRRRSTSRLMNQPLLELIAFLWNAY